MWGEIATTGCSRFIILIKRSDFPSVPSLPCVRYTADDIPCKKEIPNGCQRRFVTLDSTFPTVGSQAPTELFYPEPPKHSPSRLLSTTDTISILSAKAEENIFHVYIKQERQQEMKKSWPGRPREWGRKMDGGEGNLLFIPLNYRARLCRETFLAHMCIIAVKLSSVNKRRCVGFFFCFVFSCPTLSTSKCCHPS